MQNGRKIESIAYMYLVVYTALEPLRLGIFRNRVLERPEPVCSKNSFLRLEKDLFNEVKNDSDFVDGIVILNLQLLSRKITRENKNIDFDLNVSGISTMF